MRPLPRPRASLASIADEAGVSISTVSRIANGQLNRANSETVARIQTLLRQHGYRPDNIGRALQRGRSRIVAMLSPNLNNPAMAAIASSTEAALRAAGYVMILCDTHDEPALQDEYLDAMRSQGVEGYIVVSGLPSAGLDTFVKRGEPIVMVGRRPAANGNSVPFVGIDNRGAGATVADFMLAMGIERPAVIHSALISSAIADRVTGFCDRLTGRGISAGEIRQAQSEHLQHLLAGYEAIGRLIAEGGWPGGLFCASDLMAYGAFRRGREDGIEIPRDCLVVGIDDNVLNAWIAPWLTSVHVPYEDYGAAIVDQLRAIWGGEAAPDRLLPYRLVPRDCGRTTVS